jgi:hemoglobin
MRRCSRRFTAASRHKPRALAIPGIGPARRRGAGIVLIEFGMSRSLMRPTLFEFAGGEPAFLALAVAHHARCLLDPELNHPFSHPDQHPQHVERLAAYWAEVLGGPPRYSQSCGDHSGVLHMHSGNGDMGDLGQRFLDCFMRALDDVGMPGDVEFRAAMRAYMAWAVDDMLAYPLEQDTVPMGLAMPRWSWDGLQSNSGHVVSC